MIDAFLHWLTEPAPPFPSVSWGEALFSPLVLLAFGLGVWMVVNLWRDLRRVPGSTLRAIRRADLRREALDTIVDGGFVLVALAVLTDHPRRAAVFTLAMLAYALLRAVNRVLERRYRFDRERYYEAERLRVRVLAEAAAQAEIVAAARLAEQADRAARLEAGVAETKAMAERAAVSSEKAAEASEEAAHVANTVNRKIERLGLAAEADRARLREQDERKAGGD